MRNLKRALSLAMAAAMLLGMMVIGAGAASYNDFTDKDEIVNKEAVALLVDLGIIDGTTATTYNPAGTLERAAISKLIFKVMMGNADESVYKGTNTGLTDVTGTWAEGFINYCFANGILSGVGGDKFAPSSPLTVAAAAKTMLTALGYKSSDRGYEGDMWSINVMRDAQINNLLVGINQSSSDSITRDTAAQLIYNTLMAQTVTPEYAYDMGVQYVTRYVAGNTLGYSTYGLIKVTGTVDGIAGGKASLTSINPATAATVVDEKLPATPDMIGTSVVAYVRGSVAADGTVSVSSLYSTALTPGATNVLGTSTNGSTIANLTTRSNSNYIAPLAADVAYFYNGDPKTIGAGDSDDYDDIVELSADCIKVGSIVEFINTDSDSDAEIVKITTKIVDSVTGAVSTRTSGKVLQVNIPGVSGGWKAASTFVGYEDLANGDVVLTVTIGGVTYIEKAASIQGTVSSKNSNGTITVGGVRYAASGLGGASYTSSESLDYVNTYNFFLDDGSNIVATAKVTEENAAQYAVILDIVYIDGTVSAGAATSGYAEALVLYSDGSTEVKRVASIGGNTPIKGETAGTVDTEDKTITISGANSSTPLEGAFYTYTLNTSGNLVMTPVADDRLSTVSGDIVTGQAKFSEGNAIGNSATVFLVATTSGKTTTYTAYTGIANVPRGTATAGTAVKAANGISSFVYVNMTPAASTATTMVYVTNSVYGTSYNPATGVTTYVYDVVINGEETTIQAAANNIFTSKGLWACTTSNDVVQSTGTSKVTGKAISAVGGGVLQLADVSTVYTYDDDTVVYLFEDDTLSSVGTGADLAATPSGYTDAVFVAPVGGANTTNLLAEVYIVRTVTAE